MIPRARWTPALLVLTAAASTARSEEKPPIKDNSFLIEEAYNQESRVVQHIFTWMPERDGGAWGFTFTQAWPAGGQRHQLSHTIPVQRLADAEGGARGLGDVPGVAVPIGLGVSRGEDALYLYLSFEHGF